MKGRCFVWLERTGAATGAWLVADGSSESDSGELRSERDIAELKDRIGTQPVTFVIPGEGVKVSSVSLPNKSRDALKTVPFQLEAEWLSALDDLHWGFISKKARQRNQSAYEVYVCSRQWLQQWREVIQTIGLNVERVVPDYLFLPSQEEPQHFFRWQQRMLLRGEVNGILPVSQVGLLEGQGYTGLLNTDGSENARSSRELLASLVSSSFEVKDINLLSGEYAIKKQVELSPKPFLMLFCFVSLLLVNWALDFRELKLLQAYETKMDEERSELFSSVVGHDVKMVDPVHQMRIAIEARKLQAQDPLLISLLTPIALQFADGGVLLSQISFDKQEGRLEVLSEPEPDQAKRDALIKHISAAGFSVSEQGGNLKVVAYAK